MKTQPKIITSQCTDCANNTKPSYHSSFDCYFNTKIIPCKITNLKGLDRWGQLKYTETDKPLNSK